MIYLIIPAAVRKGYTRSVTCRIFTWDSLLAGTTSLYLQMWRNDAAACLNFPRKLIRKTQIRKHYYKLTIVNRAKVVTISVGAVLLLLFWSTWLFVLTARHVLRCHHSLAPPTLLFYLLILPSHLHSILSSLSPVFKMPSCLLFFVSP